MTQLTAYIINVYYLFDEYPTSQRIVYAKDEDEAMLTDASMNPGEYAPGSSFGARLVGSVKNMIT
jgi:hypothetical protein